jgi:Integrase zinc binding domain
LFVDGENNGLADHLSRPERGLKHEPKSKTKDKRTNKQLACLEIQKYKQIWRIHNHPFYWHPGVKNTIYLIQKDGFTDAERIEVSDIVKRCDKCQRFKTYKTQNIRYMREFTHPDIFGLDISLNIFGPLYA